MENHLPPAAQEKYQELQDLQEEATAVVEEKEQAETRLEDSRAALDALEGADDGTAVHRQVGQIRVQTTSGDIRPELEGRIEELEEQIDDLEGRKQRLEEQFQNRKADIKHLLGGHSDALGTPGTSE